MGKRARLTLAELHAIGEALNARDAGERDDLTAAEISAADRAKDKIYMMIALRARAAKLARARRQR